MGESLALQIARAFPSSRRTRPPAAAALCARAPCTLSSGVISTRRALPSHFRTKRHWRDAARLADIEAGLVDLVDVLRVSAISIPIPELWC